MSVPGPVAAEQGQQPMAPRIARLAAELATAGRAGRAAVLQAFWDEVAAAGTPLVEPAEPDQHWVTFLWRRGVDDVGLPEPVVPVMVMGGPALWWQLPQNVLQPLPGSDLLFRSYRAGSDLRGRYVLAPGDPLTDLPAAGTPAAVVRSARFQPDSRNTAPWELPADDPLRPSITYSTFALPSATAAPWVGTGAAAPAGAVRCDRVSSSILGNTRRVWTYQPPGGRDSQLLLVMLDGRDWMEWVPLTETLDRLIADGGLPPIAVVAPESLDTATRYAELTCRDEFTGFLTDELLPWAGGRVPVPSDPARIALHGMSFGGLAAMSAGWSRPDVFGTVLSQSGSFWWTGWDAPPGSPELVPQRFADSERRPLRVSLDIGRHEGEAMADSHALMAQTLRRRGYELRTHEFNGGHDLGCWICELPAALRWWAPPTPAR